MTELGKPPQEESWLGKTMKKLIASVNWDAVEESGEWGPTGTCGYPENRKDVNEYYIVTIHSASLNRTVRALIQTDFVTSVRSTWAEASITRVLSAMRQEITQAVLSVGLGSQFMTRRIWHNTTPMQLQLKLKFESVDDAKREVVLPCATLQQLALPAKLRFAGEKNWLQTGIENVLIVPPGPNPFYVSENAPYIGGGVFSRHPGDKITINIGNLMKFESVLVRDVEVSWGRRFNKQGKPINATATIHFESFEIFTKEDIYEGLIKHGGLEQFADSSFVKEAMQSDYL